MDDVAMFLAGQREFGARVHAIAEAQWAASTPCTQWRVADLVGHLVDEHRWAPPLLHGMDLDSAAKVVAGARELPVDGGVGANFAEAWDEAATASADAFTAEGAIEREVALSRGPTPAGAYLSEMIFDLVVHSWDLGVAIGYPDPVSEELAAYVYDCTGAGDLAGSGLFDPAVTIGADATTIDKLVAATGRRPR